MLTPLASTPRTEEEALRSREHFSLARPLARRQVLTGVYRLNGARGCWTREKSKMCGGK